MILAKKEVEIDDVEQEIQSVGEDEENVEIENIEGKVIFNHLNIYLLFLTNPPIKCGNIQIYFKIPFPIQYTILLSCLCLENLESPRDTLVKTETIPDTKVENSPVPKNDIEAQGQKEENVDIDLNDAEVQEAAVKIQAGFKGMKARKEVNTLKENKLLNNVEQPQISDNIDENDDIDLNDPNVEDAACKIQAGFKGMKARKEVSEMKRMKEDQPNDQLKIMDDNIPDIDITDPDVEAAATKIQAGYKGMKARKEVKAIKDIKHLEDDLEAKESIIESHHVEDIDIDLNDPDVGKAATKIQAGFKGMKARKEVRNMKVDNKGNEEDNDKVVDDESKVIENIDKNLENNDTVKENYDKVIENDKVIANDNKVLENDKVVYDKERKLEADDEKNSTGIDIDLNDPDVEHAATKIQAGFKGMKARKKVGEIKEEKLQNAIAESSLGESEEPKNVDAKETVDNKIEDVDIDLNDPDVEHAATKIQAGFKGMKARKRVGEMKEEKSQISNQDSTSTKFEEPISIIPKVTVEENTENIDIDLNDPDVEHAATKIQAGFKGMKARKEVELIKQTQDMKTASEEEAKETELVEDEIDIDLNDPDVEKAATKIQAGFKGMKARKEVSALKSNAEMIEDTSINHVEIKESDTLEENKNLTTDVPMSMNEVEKVDIDLNDPEVEQAATKIQAGFKGMKARKEVSAIRETEIEMDYSKEGINLNQDNYQKALQAKKEKDVEDVVDIDLEDPNVEVAATKIQAGFKGMKARKEVEIMKENKEEKKLIIKESEKTPEIDIDLNDPEVEQAATKIQAGFKGMKARKEVVGMKSKTEEKEIIKSNEFEVNENNGKHGNHEEILTEDIDIDLNDPEVEQAATKIQAGFKGMKARKEVNNMKNNVNDSENLDSNLEEADIDLNDPELEQAATKIQAGFKGMKARKEVVALKDKQNQPEISAIADFEHQTEEKDDAEKVDIDLSDPDVEVAATKIQAGFKGMKARKEVSSLKNQTQLKAEDVLKDNNDSEIDIDLTDPDVEQAATKIQAGFKGMKARKEVNNLIKKQDLDDENTEKVDIDLDDPEVEAAATKIQAGFKGMKARKEVKDKFQSKNTDVVSEASTNEIVVEGSPEPLNDNKDVFQKGSIDDGYSSESWSGENTFDEGGEKVDPHTLSADNKVDPQQGHVCQLALGVAGSTVSAPIFTKFGNNTQNPHDGLVAEGLSITSNMKLKEPKESISVIEENLKTEVVEKDKGLFIPRESSGNVSRVGAIPFDLHDTVINAQNEPNYSSEKSLTKMDDDLLINEEFEIMKDEIVHVYTEDQEVEQTFKLFLYLEERGIPYQRTNLSSNDLLTSEWQESNPNGLLPLIRYQNQTVVAGDILKIFDSLEQNYPVDRYPMMIPCTTSTNTYQKYLFYSTQLENINIKALNLHASSDLEGNVKMLEKRLNSLKGILVLLKI